MMTDECGAINGIKLAGKTEVFGENLPESCVIHYKSLMT
jgi:hypothetical protein